jgi:hypothetical protein
MSHDYDWNERHEKDRQHWPTGALERTLLRDGVRSLSEAVKKRMKSGQIESPPEVPLKPQIFETQSQDPEYEAMCAAIREIEDFSKGFDFNSLPADTTASLANMPIRTIEEVGLWVAAWKKTILEQIPYVW